MSNSIVGATALNKKEDDAKLKSATDNEEGLFDIKYSFALTSIVRSVESATIATWRSSHTSSKKATLSF